MRMPNPGSRQYPERPILGVGALIFDGDNVLLIKRGHDPLSGYWSLPGGAVETGERLEEALRREVYEETGLVVSVDSLATIFERIMPDHEGLCEYHYVLIDFYCSVLEGQLRPGDDSADARWFPVATIGELLLTAGTHHVVEDCWKRRSMNSFVARP